MIDNVDFAVNCDGNTIKSIDNRFLQPSSSLGLNSIFKTELNVYEQLIFIYDLDDVFIVCMYGISIIRTHTFCYYVYGVLIASCRKIGKVICNCFERKKKNDKIVFEHMLKISAINHKRY